MEPSRSRELKGTSEVREYILEYNSKLSDSTLCEQKALKARKHSLCTMEMALFPLGPVDPPLGLLEHYLKRGQGADERSKRLRIKRLECGMELEDGP